MSVNLLSDALEVTFSTANRAVDHLERLGIVEEVTDGRRNRIFRYSPYLALFAEPDQGEPAGSLETTAAADEVLRSAAADGSRGD